MAFWANERRRISRVGSGRIASISLKAAASARAAATPSSVTGPRGPTPTDAFRSAWKPARSKISEAARSRFGP